jgi:hypothetical protein
MMPQGCWEGLAAGNALRGSDTSQAYRKSSLTCFRSGGLAALVLLA